MEQNENEQVRTNQFNHMLEFLVQSIRDLEQEDKKRRELTPPAKKKAMNRKVIREVFSPLREEISKELDAINRFKTEYNHFNQFLAEYGINSIQEMYKKYREYYGEKRYKREFKKAFGKLKKIERLIFPKKGNGIEEDLTEIQKNLDNILSENSGSVNQGEVNKKIEEMRGNGNPSESNTDKSNTDKNTLNLLNNVIVMLQNLDKKLGVTPKKRFQKSVASATLFFSLLTILNGFPMSGFVNNAQAQDTTSNTNIEYQMGAQQQAQGAHNDLDNSANNMDNGGEPDENKSDLEDDSKSSGEIKISFESGSSYSISHLSRYMFENPSLFKITEEVETLKSHLGYEKGLEQFQKAFKDFYKSNFGNNDTNIGQISDEFGDFMKKLDNFNKYLAENFKDNNENNVSVNSYSGNISGEEMQIDGVMDAFYEVFNELKEKNGNNVTINDENAYLSFFKAALVKFKKEHNTKDLKQVKEELGEEDFKDKIEETFRAYL